ncbi:hypothetical protein [Saccharicrinis aurantiacus]|uniref:hypothetical protein n=1 Tax=Saccharicrinis aurantiacus TaxID=1849719 RepID=UPI00094FE354
MQNLGNLKYVSSENDKALTCNKTQTNKTEVFEIIELKDGLVAFKGSNGKYLSSENGKKSHDLCKSKNW